MAPWQETLQRFRAGEIDALASIARTAERERFVAFTVPTLTLQGAIFVRQGDRPIRSFAELATRRIAVQPESYAHHFLRARGWDSQLELVDEFSRRLPGARRGPLRRRHRDPDRGPERDPQENLPQHRHQRICGSRTTVSACTWACSPAMPAASPDSTRASPLVHADGTYERLYEQWIGPLERAAPAPRRFPPVIIPLIIVALAIGAAFWWQRRLLRQLSDQAARLRAGEERLQRVLDGSEDGFWDWNIETDRIDRSERWASMLGYTLREIESTLGAGNRAGPPG